MKDNSELLSPQETNPKQEGPTKKIIKKNAGDIVERKEIKVVTEDGKELL